MEPQRINSFAATSAADGAALGATLGDDVLETLGPGLADGPPTEQVLLQDGAGDQARRHLLALRARAGVRPRRHPQF